MSPHIKNIEVVALLVMGFSNATVALSSELGMISIPSGSFDMGCRGCKLSDAEPVHQVEISSFWMDETPVTNREFQDFVANTHYRTIAEQKPDPKDYPTVPAESLVAGSGVFTPPKTLASLDDALAWWSYVPDAYWRHPEGPSSNIKGRMDHPVVHIAYADADAYCTWRGKSLPTEAQYEYAARGGLKGKRYAWGDELKPKGKWAANIWQGTFPLKNEKSDGYEGTSPVKVFPPNGYGLYDMGGNVWQWTSDWYRPDTYEKYAASGVVRDPQGPSDSYDPKEPGLQKRVQRGGSFLCSSQYCTRFLVGSRGKGAIDSAASNIGFRCAKAQPHRSNS